MNGLIQGYGGLSIIDITAFQGPVQIVRQTISNLDIPISTYTPYQRYEGLSSPAKKRGIERIYQTTIYTNPICLISGYKGLADMKV
jgi:hypothetical protein